MQGMSGIAVECNMLLTPRQNDTCSLWVQLKMSFLAACCRNNTTHMHKQFYTMQGVLSGAGARSPGR